MAEFPDRCGQIMEMIENDEWNQEEADKMEQLVAFDTVRYGNQVAEEAIQRTRDADDDWRFA